MKKIISFNSRPHTEVDRILSHCQSEHNAFQLTTSHGGRLTDAGFTYAISIFQLTTSHGGRPFHFQRNGAQKGPFNSRPHTEVDEIVTVRVSSSSTFQLTTSHGGRLVLHQQQDYDIYLSTHDLTRRSTILNCENGILTIFQLTTSHGGRQSVEGSERNHGNFQLTTSHGGRRFYVHGQKNVDVPFNSRPHTEVDCSRQWDQFGS